MPPPLRRTVSDGAAKRRRPKVAGTRVRPVGSAEPRKPPEKSVPEKSVPDKSVRENTVPAGRQNLVRVLAVLVVVLSGFAAVAALRPGATEPNRAWVDGKATVEVTQAAAEAIEAVFTYDYATIDRDFDKARGYLNEARRAEFDQTARTTKDAAIQTRTATEASVTDIGVTVLDDDRAELLAQMNVSATGDGVAQGSVATPLSIKMEKVDGTWVLSDISDSAG